MLQEDKLSGKSNYKLPSGELVPLSVNVQIWQSCQCNINLLKARGPKLLNEF